MAGNKKKDPIVFGYYFVAFIDLLNQREALGKIKDLPVTEEEKQKFFQVLRESFGVVDGFRNLFEGFFNQNVKSSIPSEMILEEHRNAFSESQKIDIKFQGFSDTVVIYVSLNTETIKAPINGVFSALAACASTFLLSMAAGHVCRGGIEIGVASEFYEGEIYGPVLLEAYRLESEVAQYPRVVIGDEVINYLGSMKQAKGEDYLTKLNNEVADVCLSLLVRDVDGNIILDYLGEGFKKHMAPDGLEDIPKRAYEFVVNELEKWKKARDTKLSIRYNLLRNYLNSRRSFWEDTKKSSDPGSINRT